MTKKSFLVKSVLMSMFTVATFTGFTSCQDDVIDLDTASQTEESAITRSPQVSDYNLNDHSVIKGGTTFSPFNRKEWWGEESIFLYVGGNAGQDIMGEENSKYYNRLGYELQNLPWVQGSSTHSQIPQAIISDLVNDKDNWQLVMMQCGNEATRNGNYLGFYHKYRGVLRILTYLKPGQVNKTNYLWGFSMGDELASHSVFGYALPEDKVASIDEVKQALDMGDRFNKTVTPMMNKSSWDKANSCAPTEGWWSFDIDLSVYNSKNEVKSSNPRDVLLTLHPLGYETADYEFSSAMEAAAIGNIKMEEYQSSSDGDVVGPILKGIDVIGKVADIAAKSAEGKVAEAVSGGVDLAKTGCEIAGIGSKESGYKGDIHLDMSGNITTGGQSKKGAIFDEMPAVDLKLANFDFEDNTLGQGVWNLETAPVVYCTNAEVNWMEEWSSEVFSKTIFSRWKRFTQYFAPVQSPFGGMFEKKKSDGGEHSGKPWHGLVCFFDPSSVKVMLNPEVFTPSEIDGAMVTAVCGVRKGSNYSRYEQQRTAQKLQSTRRQAKSTLEYTNRWTGEEPFNAFGLGVSQFSTDNVNGVETGCIGAGDDDYLVEPVALRGQRDTEWGDYYLPAYEVTVTVTIKLENGKTLVLSRTYLPEIKDMDAMQVESYYNKLKDGVVEMPAHYMPAYYNQQVARVGRLNHWMRSTPIATNGTPRLLGVLWYLDPLPGECVGSNWDHPLCTYSRLIDGDKQSKWASHRKNGKYEDNDFNKTAAKGLSHHCWFAEFKTYGKMKPKSFTLTSSDTGEDKKPRDIRLFARNDGQGDWVELYMEDGIKMPTGKYTEMTFEIPSYMQGWYNTYRFEVGANWGGSFLDLNELTMNWAE